MSEEKRIAALEAENEQLHQTLYQRDAFIRWEDWILIPKGF